MNSNRFSWLFELLVPVAVSVSFILILFPTNKPFLLLGHDAGYALDPSMWAKSRFTVWSSAYNFGQDQSLYMGLLLPHVLEAVFSWVSFSVFTGQKLTLIFWFSAMAVSMHFFVRTFYREDRYRWLRIFSSLFYILNPFLLTRLVVFERSGFSLLVALPITLAVVLRYLRGQISAIKMASVLGVVFFFFNSGGIPPFVAIFWIILWFTLLYYLIVEGGVRSIKSILLVGLLLPLLYGLVNAYWILPFIHTQFTAYETVVAASKVGIIVWLREASRYASLFNVLSLHGTAPWPESLWDKLGHSLLPIVIFSALILVRGAKDKFFVYFFSLLAVVFTVLAAGSHPPFGAVYNWMIEHIPFFAIFRTPIYKFSFGTIFAYSFLFGFSMQWIMEHIPKHTYIGAGFFGLLLLAVNYQYFTPYPFQLESSFTRRVQVPEYVFTVGNYFKTIPTTARILLLPKIAENYGGVDAYQWGYWSLAPLPLMAFPQSVIFYHQDATIQRLLSDLHTAIRTNDRQKILSYVRLFAISHFLLRYDVDFSQKLIPTDDPQLFTEILTSIPFLKHEKTFGQWSIYTVDAAYRTPLIYSLEGNPSIEFGKVNSTKYYVYVKNVQKPYTLIFAEAFNPNWKLYVKKRENGSSYLVPESQHRRIYEYANAWTINPQDSGREEEYTLIIEYYPQRLFYIGAIISVISFLVALLIFIKQQHIVSLQ